MISERRIEKINRVVKDMVYDFKGETSFGVPLSFQYQFKIVGQREMISVGEYYDHLKVSVDIIDGDERTITIFTVYESLNSDLRKEYKIRNLLDRDISDELTYFFGSDGIRVIIEEIKFGDELRTKMDEIKLKFNVK